MEQSLFSFTHPEKIYSVLEINTLVREVIKNEFPQPIWVCGEIQGLRLERDKKHVYFELAQKNPAGDDIMARVKMALFINRKQLIFDRIKSAGSGFELANDIEVKFLCEVSLHPATGQYSLIIIDIDPSYTLGKVAQNRLKIIEELKKENLFDRNKTLTMPVVPLNVGLITALDCAAYHDFINELTASGFGFKVFVFNAYMQGKNTEHDVCQAMRYFNDLASDDLDVVVITRGGGSKADLSWFDNKNIAKAVALSKFPVITALGHQIDESVTDLVAHTAVKTPTKAGQFLTESARIFLDQGLKYAQASLNKAQEILSSNKQTARSIAIKLNLAINNYFEIHKQKLWVSRNQIGQFAAGVLPKQRFLLDGSWSKIKTQAQQIIFNALQSNLSHEHKVKLLDPQNVLKRGYSITVKNNKLIKSIDDLAQDDIITTRLANGVFNSKVIKRQKKLFPISKH